jgi:hypothetical protein
VGKKGVGPFFFTLPCLSILTSSFPCLSKNPKHTNVLVLWRGKKLVALPDELDK